MEEISRVISALRQVFENKGVPPPLMGPHTLLDRSLGLDSLDYAEAVVRLDNDFGTDPFAAPEPPIVRTIADLANAYVDHR